MSTDLDVKLHALIRDTYVRERRNFEYRLSGVPSGYGSSHMPKWDGTGEFRAGASKRSAQDKYGRVYTPIWPRIADYAVKNGVDPFELIRARFKDTRGPTPPEPTDCMSIRALEACLREAVPVEELNKQLSDMYMLFMTELENRSIYMIKYTGWTPDLVAHSVITDLTIPFNPLYRYYLATLYGLTDKTVFYREAAVMEYVSNRKSLDKSSWVSILPKELMNEIRALAA